MNSSWPNAPFAPTSRLFARLACVLALCAVALSSGVARGQSHIRHALTKESDFEQRRAELIEAYATVGSSGNSYAQLCRLATDRSPNEAAFESALDMMDNRQDTADFRLGAILRMLYQFGDSPLLSQALLERTRQSVLGFKYWPDEPGTDSLCTWTENHQILYAGGAYLAGQFYPTEIFTNSGQTGAQLMATHRPRIMTWLDLRFRSGFSEWLSNVYYDEDIAALVNLVDFAQDPEIKQRAAMVLDMMLLDMALNTYQGMFVSTHGRTYERQKKWPLTENTMDTSWLVFGLGTLRATAMSGAYLALSPEYTPPPVIELIANDFETPAMENRQRMGLKLEDAASWDLAFDNYEDGMVWLSLEAYAHPLMLELFVDMLNDFNWWDNDFFAPFAAQRALIEQMQALGQLPALATAYELDITRNLRDEVNVYTYRTPDYMLSSAQDYRPGYGGDQQHIWQATLGPDAVCFTTHPSQYDDSYTPNYWEGYGWMPRVAQYKNVAIIIHNAIDQPGLYVPTTLDFTHAWVPKDAFDEVLEESGWVFARHGNAYMAFRSQNDYEWQSGPGEDQNREMLVAGRQNIYLCELGCRDDNGEFAQFRTDILAAPLTFDGLSVTYDSPSQGTLQFSWTGDFLVDGQPAALEDYPRFSNPYVTASFPADIVEVEYQDHSLLLNWTGMTREVLYAPPSPCDMNGDGSVNALDIQLVIIGALGGSTGHDCDVNDDGSVNAIDIQLTVNAALGIV